MGIFDIFKSKNKNKLPKNLVFKSNDGVYEYIQKFFSDVDVVPKQAIFGRVFKINKSKKPYICIVTLPNCLVNNKTETIAKQNKTHEDTFGFFETEKAFHCNQNMHLTNTNI